MATDSYKAWRDFAHTLRVITAATLARHDLVDVRVRPGRFVKRFQVTLLAAAGDGVAVPNSEVIAPGGGLALAFEVREEEIWVRLQLKGFASLQANANRQARLVSSNGAIDYAFRFGSTGNAVCVLANVSEVRQGLTSLTVLVEAPEEP